MRRIAVLFLVFIGINSFAQKPGSVDSLYNDFKKIYFASLPKEEHFGAMLDATEWALQPMNPNYREVWKLYKKQFNTQDVDTLAYRITDTILRNFHERDMWSQYTSFKEKNLAVISAHTDALCPCITQKLQSIKDPDGRYRRREFNIQKFMSECRAALRENIVELLAAIIQSLKAIPASEQTLLERSLGLSLYDNCTEYKKFWTSMFQEESRRSTGHYLFRLVDNIDETIISLHSRKKIDSLQTFFPAYATYSKQIELFKPVNLRKFNILFGRNDRNETIRRDTITLFKEKILHGQRVISYSIEGLDIKVFSFEFYTADKIKNKKYYLDRMKEENDFEPPPPPMPPVLRGQ